MKASLKFRDEGEKPLFRAKVPLSILGMPFQSGIVAGNSKELTLNLATFFDSGPSFKLAYRPNDSKNPFSFILKTGTGSFGSPLNASMLMTCHFNLPAQAGSPFFMLHFKPRFGDFSFKKTHSSVFDGKGFSKSHARNDDVASLETTTPFMESSTASLFPPDSPPAAAVARVFSGVEVAARTTLPVLGRAALKLRWGVRVPAEPKGTAFRRIPFLVMDKVSVEHVMEGCGDWNKREVQNGGGKFPPSDDVAAACFALKRQMEALHAENGLLRSAVEDLRREFLGGSEFGRGKNPNNRKSNNKTTSDYANIHAKSTQDEASEELKKALKGAAPIGA